MKQTRTEFYDAANAAMRGIGMMEEVGWAVRQIVPTALGLIVVVYERVLTMDVPTGKDET